jgi:antirestriction protein ArdC
MVVFWKWLEQEDEETGEKKEVPLLRYYNVFHIDQCEGLRAKHTQPMPHTANADTNADAIIADYLAREGVKLNHEAGDRAFYRPSTDSITLPHIAQFAATAEYYSTAFHELTHSTGHSKRLNRLEKTAFFGSEAYSKEELIAEIGAAALVNVAGLETAKSFRNTAAYIQNWLSVLKNDKKFIVTASGKAEKAVNLILGTAA